MPWQDEYLRGLQERDKKEKANQALYNSYAKLANRTAALQAASSANVVEPDEPTPLSKQKQRQISSVKGASSSSPGPNTLIKVRQELGEAQRSRGLLESRLQRVTEDLKKLKIQSSIDSKRIGELTKERNMLITGLRDRDEELRGKAKLLEDVHDETVSLTLQLNLADEQSRKLQRENKELVDRWMARMGSEADALNNESKFS